MCGNDYHFVEWKEHFFREFNPCRVSYGGREESLWFGLLQCCLNEILKETGRPAYLAQPVMSCLSSMEAGHVHCAMNKEEDEEWSVGENVIVSDDRSKIKQAGMLS
ncbi:unnamed protein product [Cochlearia groenlandica]